MTAVLPTPCATALPDLVGADLRVPLVTGEWVRAANLDLAASAPALRAVADHVAELLPHHASVHRGAGYASQVCTAVVERGRDAVAAFVGAREDDVVVFTRNTTDALNLLAGCVPGAVLRLDLEHHATLLAWRSGRVLETAPTVEQTLDRLADALAHEAFALVAVTGASNVTGEVPPLRRIVELAHAAGARVVVDAAQLAPHRRVDLAATGADYLALSGHKIYAPYGAGALVGRRDWLDAGQPYLAGGGAVTAVTADGAATWARAPHRHEAGTPNVLGVAALARACRRGGGGGGGPAGPGEGPAPGARPPPRQGAGPPNALGVAAVARACGVLDGVVDAVARDHERAFFARLTAGLDAVPGVRALRI